MLLIVNELVGIGIEDKLHKFDQNSYVHLRVFFFFNHKIGRSFLFIDFISTIIFLYYTSELYYVFFLVTNKFTSVSVLSVLSLKIKLSYKMVSCTF